jgi:hypothetical protein
MSYCHPEVQTSDLGYFSSHPDSNDASDTSDGDVELYDDEYVTLNQLNFHLNHVIFTFLES